MNVYTGPLRALARITLRLVPLTPIHIGDGTEMRLDEYLLEEAQQPQKRYDEFGEEIEEAASERLPMLCRFDQAKAMRAMTLTQRAALQRALDAGKLAEAARLLRQAGAGAIVERIQISRRSGQELRKAMEDPENRSGQVKPFVRSGGRPYIPGSSVKGALRTALASAALPRDAEPADGWSHESAMEAAFGLEPGRTETDPLRLLHVSDAVLPADATLIDRVEVMDRRNPDAGKMQMHYERTRALTDGADAPAFTVRLAADARAMESACVAREAARFGAAQVLARCRAFHVKLFKEELNWFFKGSDETRPTLRQCLGGHVADDGRPPWREQRWDPDFLLLRLGRFGHFESKSLDGVRRGHFPQAKNPADRRRQPGDWGLTRTVTRDARGNPIPFGWVIGWVVKEERA